MWTKSKTINLLSGNTMAVPLDHAHSLISVKPVNCQMYTFSNQVSWETVMRPNDCLYELRACHTNRGHIYR